MDVVTYHAVSNPTISRSIPHDAWKCWQPWIMHPCLEGSMQAMAPHAQRTLTCLAQRTVHGVEQLPPLSFVDPLGNPGMCEDMNVTPSFPCMPDTNPEVKKAQARNDSGR